jgi:hypothetical protein
MYIFYESWTPGCIYRILLLICLGLSQNGPAVIFIKASIRIMDRQMWWEVRFYEIMDHPLYPVLLTHAHIDLGYCCYAQKGKFGYRMCNVDATRISTVYFVCHCIGLLLGVGLVSVMVRGTGSRARRLALQACPFPLPRAECSRLLIIV